MKGTATVCICYAVIVVAMCIYAVNKGVGDSVRSEARASPLLSLLHKDIGLQIKIIRNCVISIAEHLFSFLKLIAGLTMIIIKPCVARRMIEVNSFIKQSVNSDHYFYREPSLAV